MDRDKHNKGVTVIDERSNEPSNVKPKCGKQGTTDEGNKNQLIANQVMPNMRRGKDIKCFADLPPDVQMTIDSLSMVDGKICQTVKANRTAIAINYQHLFPDRFYSTGVAI